MATRKKILTALLAVMTIGTTAMQAQNDKKDFTAFKHMDLGVTVGSTGLGIDIASPLGNSVQVRTGFEIMPRFEQSLHFDIQSFGYNEDGQIQSSKFDIMADRDQLPCQALSRDDRQADTMEFQADGRCLPIP